VKLQALVRIVLALVTDLATLARRSILHAKGLTDLNARVKKLEDENRRLREAQEQQFRQVNSIRYNHLRVISQTLWKWERHRHLQDRRLDDLETRHKLAVSLLSGPCRQRYSEVMRQVKNRRFCDLYGGHPRRIGHTIIPPYREDLSHWLSEPVRRCIDSMRDEATCDLYADASEGFDPGCTSGDRSEFVVVDDGGHVRDWVLEQVRESFGMNPPDDISVLRAEESRYGGHQPTEVRIDEKLVTCPSCEKHAVVGDLCLYCNTVVSEPQESDRLPGGTLARSILSVGKRKSILRGESYTGIPDYGHILWDTGQPGVPHQICDSDGEVVLGLCRVCGRAEADLDRPCVTAYIQTTAVEGDHKSARVWDGKFRPGDVVRDQQGDHVIACMTSMENRPGQAPEYSLAFEDRAAPRAMESAVIPVFLPECEVPVEEILSDPVVAGGAV